MVDNSSKILQELFELIESRKEAETSSSYTAQLFNAGMPEIARKVGEEAIEIITAALTQPDLVTEESADLLYHLLVLWSAAGIRPVEIWSELESRQGTSGIKEKKLRKP